MTDAELNDMEADAQRELAACGAYYVPHCVGYTLTLVAEVRRLKSLVPKAPGDALSEACVSYAAKLLARKDGAS